MTAGKYFNRAVMALDAPHIGFVVRETPDKIVVFGEKNERYDIPISEIQHVSKNVLIGLNFSDIAKSIRWTVMRHFQHQNTLIPGVRMEKLIYRIYEAIWKDTIQ